MQRQREIAVESEEELLRMQEQFAASNAKGDARPAAKVTRISRRPAPAATPAAAAAAAPNAQPGGCTVHGPGCQGHHGGSAAAPPEQQAAVDLMATLQAAMKEIVGEVQERPVVPSPAPPLPPAAPPAAAAGGPGSSFPEATHRRLSKFALGRQRQRSVPPVGADEAAAAALAPPQLPASMDEGSRIDAENRHLLSAMSAEQLQEARDEALQRLPPAAVEFLRKRGAARAAAGAANAGTAAAGSGDEGASTAGKAAPDGGASNAAGGGQRPAQRPRRQQQVAASVQRGASQGTLAARLRFSMDGTVVGLRSAASVDADVAPADVSERDPLRQEEGAGGQGYSVQEACLLARSSLPQQRQLALRLLAAVLALSRPRPGAVPGGGTVPLPSNTAAELQQEQQGGAPELALEWAAVWHHALHSADIVLLLRRSLDDSHPAVAAAAAEALSALLGASGLAEASEEAAAEAADACPLTGWPAPPLRHLQRPTAGGAWVAAPTLPDLLGGGEVEVEEGDEEALDEQQLAKVDPLSGLLHMQVLERAVYLIGTARAAAALDPLLSILIRCCQAGKDVADQVADAPGMLDALKTVLDAPPPLAPAAAAGSAVTEGPADAAAAAYYAARPKVLRLLRQLASASKAAARRLQESGLVRFAFEQLLRASVAPSSFSSSSSGSIGITSLTGTGSDTAAAGASSTAGTAAAAAGATPRQRGMLTEALRLWRSFAQHGFFLLSLDDAYPSLCSFFTPPVAAAAAAAIATAAAGQTAAAATGEAVAAATARAAAAALAAGAAAGGDLQQWCVAREAYSTVAQLCWHAARCEPHHSQLSPQCAAALASGALTWLAGVPLQQLVAACLPSDSSTRSQPLAAAAGGARDHASVGVGALVRLSAYPALALASGGGTGQQAVLLGTLAAAVHCVGSYWSVQLWHTAAEKKAAAQQLGQLGLLPGSGSGGDESGSSGTGPVLQAVGELLERVVALDAVWMPQPSSASSPGQPAAAASAAAAAAVAAAELAVSLARLAATFLPHRQAAGTAAALLAPLCGQQAAARFLQAAEAADPTLSQPWDAARQEQLLPLARAATAGLQAAAVAGRAEGRALPAPAVDTALALLRLLPPGQEPAALQLLALLLGPQQLAGTAAAANLAIQAAAGGGKVGFLAAQHHESAASDGGQEGSGPPAPPSVRLLSRVLLAGYAAAWLGLVPDPEQGSGEQEERAGAALALEPPPNAALLRPQGSRLPLPADWAVQELPLPPGEAGIAADAGIAAAGALLLLLGCEEGHPASLAGAAVEQKLRSAVLLLFGEQGPSSGVVPGVVPGASLAAVAEEEEEHPVWRHPLARWCLAALMERYASATGSATAKAATATAIEAEAEEATGEAGTGFAAAAAVSAVVAGGPSWQQQESRQLAERFAAVSYGDRLFGAAVALLLRQAVPLDTQLEVLAVVEEGQALHLLPPLHLLPGPASAYLNPPGDSGTGAFGRACFGLAPGGSSTGSSRRQELDLYIKLLTEGPLERCLTASSNGSGDDSPEAKGSSKGNGSCYAGCSVAVPLVLHRLACACFPRTRAQPTADQQQQQQQQQGLLVELLQRCTGGTPALLCLLGWLLRWDVDAGQPSDVITQGRLAAIEAACVAGGMDAAGLLRAAVEA